MPPHVTVVQSSVRKICQLTGEFDRERNQPAFNKTESRFGLFGTDLGYSFEHGGKLWFLFGDTWPGARTIQTTDSVAWTTDDNPEPGIHLEFRSDNGRYRSPQLRDQTGAVLSTEAYEVPIAGISSNGQMYVFHSTDRIDGQGGGGGLDVFWIGPDGAVGTTWANPAVDLGRWHSPFPTTPPGASRLQAPIAAVTRFENALDIFWIGSDGAIGTTWSNPQTDSGNWQPPFPITPSGAARTDSPVAAITRLEGALDVFWIGPDGAVGTTWANPRVNNSRWYPPFPISPPGAARTDSPIAAVTRLDGALDVFWIGPDGAVGTTWANPNVDDGRWHPPFPITPPGATRAHAPLAVVTRLEGALDAFWIGPDGAVGTTWANPGIDSGRWHPPFPITPPGAARTDSSLAAVTRSSGDARALMGRTVLARAQGNDPTDLVALYDVSRLDQDGKFINVACVVAAEGMHGLPFESQTLLVWGSGRYRESDVYLACVPLTAVENPAAWRFLTGWGIDAQPQWHEEQRSAVPLFNQRQVGELSVAWIEPLSVWLLLYNATTPRGINARVASSPWGPWSEPFVSFDPGWPGLGYGHFMHIKDGDDALSDPGREHDWGGEYGPYLIHRYTHAVANSDTATRQAQVYFVLSTWNPYNTVLMTATIQREGD